VTMNGGFEGHGLPLYLSGGTIASVP
jgi:hypothetical protein